MNSRLGDTEHINDLEDIIIKITQSEHKKEKQILKNEDNLRNIWDNVKRPNIRIIGVPEEEDKKKDLEKILEIKVENVHIFGKDIITYVQEIQRVPNRINLR